MDSEQNRCHFIPPFHLLQIPSFHYWTPFPNWSNISHGTDIHLVHESSDAYLYRKEKLRCLVAPQILVSKCTKVGVRFWSVIWGHIFLYGVFKRFTMCETPQVDCNVISVFVSFNQDKLQGRTVWVMIGKKKRKWFPNCEFSVVYIVCEVGHISQRLICFLADTRIFISSGEGMHKRIQREWSSWTDMFVCWWNAQPTTKHFPFQKVCIFCATQSVPIFTPGSTSSPQPFSSPPEGTRYQERPWPFPAPPPLATH